MSTVTVTVVETDHVEFVLTCDSFREKWSSVIVIREFGLVATKSKLIFISKKRPVRLCA